MIKLNVQRNSILVSLCYAWAVFRFHLLQRKRKHKHKHKKKRKKIAILVPMLMPASRPFSRCNKNCALASLQWKPGLNGGLSFIMKFVLLFEFVINVIARAGALQSSTIYVLHQIQRDKIPSFQQCAYMNFPPEVKPLQSADWTNFRSDGKVACVISLDDGSVWKCKFKVNANYIWK